MGIKFYDSNGKCWGEYDETRSLFIPSEETITQTETQNSNLTFEKRTMRDCYNCKKYETEDECIECHYEPKDEPQTNANQHVQHVGSVEPTWTKEKHKAFYTFLWNVINPNEMQDYIGMFETKDEPQTDCAWK